MLLFSTVSVSDEARAEVNGLKASRFFSLAERLNVGAVPFIWLFIRPPWSVSGSCCKAVVHESLRAECQLQKVSPGCMGQSVLGGPSPIVLGGKKTLRGDIADHVKLLQTM